MTQPRRAGSAPPGFVVLREVSQGRWQFLGEFERKRGPAARVARTQAILDATTGTAREGDVYGRRSKRVASGEGLGGTTCPVNARAVQTHPGRRCTVPR